MPSVMRLHELKVQTSPTLCTLEMALVQKHVDATLACRRGHWGYHHGGRQISAGAKA